MKRLTSILAVLALLAAVGAVAFLLLKPPVLPVVEIPTTVAREASVEEPTPSAIEVPTGGIYAGIVVDGAGKPIQGAMVLLVAYDSGLRPRAGRVNPAEDDEEEFDLSQVAIVDFRTAAEGRTDAAGRFRIAADSEDAIQMVTAWRRGYMPELVPVRKPREDLRIVLDQAGRFEGTVLEQGTNEPVAHAKVSIYLQQKVLPPAAAPGEHAGTGGRKLPMSPFAVAQLWVAKELGSRVWGLTWEGDPALHVWTDKKGSFSFGPVGSEVQLEFVVTHPDYMWTEFDRTARGHAERTVVQPGQTVERTFLLEKGKSIAGRVIDAATQKGVPDVRIEVENVTEYTEHWWYRIKRRQAVTRSDGSFRVGGLSFGPYRATLHHPTFGTEHIHSIPENVKDAQWEVRSLGALQGRVDGFDSSQKSGRLRLMLESVEKDPTTGRQNLQRPTMRPDGTFLASGIEPGRYRIWIQVGGQSSVPEEIEIQSLQTTEHTFTLGGGGGFEVLLKDASGAWVDPAVAHLIRLGGGERTPLGRFVTRGGSLVAEGVAPGRYEIELEAPEYLPERSEPFEVVEGGMTRVGTIQLRRRAWIRIRNVVGPDGRPPRGAVQIEVRQGPDGTFRRLDLRKPGAIPVDPGPLTVRAVAEGGGAFEQTYDVPDGGSVDVHVQLSDR